jgi:hypothetical protein
VTGAGDAAGAARSCGACRHFSGSGATLEARLPGLKVLSSALGEVCAGNGVCALHDRLVPPWAGCPGFGPAPFCPAPASPA